MVLFPFAEYWGFYAGFVAFVLAVLALDLGVFHRKAHEVSFKESSLWTLIWIGLALFFNYLFYLFVQMKFDVLTAKQSALEFLTGYVVEKSLAIDNIFIFAVVFAYFGIPKKYQHRILFWGILGALFFRALFIAMGSVLMTYQVIVLLLGTFLIFTGIKMFFAGTEEKDLKDNAIIKFLNKILRVHPKIAGQKFFIRKNNLFYVTPLFLALIFIEFTDIIFAIDSVPAIFSLTKEPLIVFTSNIFAILGLRSMYFMLAGFMEKFKYIKYGLAAVLVFVGSKMAFLNDLFGGKFPITWSLLIITGLIGSSILFSLWKSSREIEIEAK
jgi:tellurite resistance protein TerC